MVATRVTRSSRSPIITTEVERGRPQTDEKQGLCPHISQFYLHLTKIEIEKTGHAPCSHAVTSSQCCWHNQTSESASIQSHLK